MRIWRMLLLCAALLSLPVSAAETHAVGSVVTEQAAGAGTWIQNDAVYAVCLYAGGGTLSEAAVTVTVEHRGEKRVCYAGRGDALADGRVLLCVLDAGGAARVWAESADVGQALTLFIERAYAPGTENRLQLAVCICIWLMLAAAGSYVTLLVVGHRRKNEHKKGGFR